MLKYRYKNTQFLLLELFLSESIDTSDKLIWLIRKWVNLDLISMGLLPSFHWDSPHMISAIWKQGNRSQLEIKDLSIAEGHQQIPQGGNPFHLLQDVLNCPLEVPGSLHHLQRARLIARFWTSNVRCTEYYLTYSLSSTGNFFLALCYFSYISAAENHRNRNKYAKLVSPSTPFHSTHAKMGGNINDSNVWPATDTYPHINSHSQMRSFTVSLNI